MFDLLWLLIYIIGQYKNLKKNFDLTVPLFNYQIVFELISKYLNESLDDL